MGVLYVIVCGSPASRGVGVLVELARADGWDVCVVATPDGLAQVPPVLVSALTCVRLDVPSIEV